MTARVSPEPSGTGGVATRKLIPLSEVETAKLIRASIGKSPLSMAFGSGGVALQGDEAPWAVALLREWRGVDFTQGAGI